MTHKSHRTRAVYQQSRLNWAPESAVAECDGCDILCFWKRFICYRFAWAIYLDLKRATGGLQLKLVIRPTVVAGGGSAFSALLSGRIRDTRQLPLASTLATRTCPFRAYCTCTHVPTTSTRNIRHLFNKKTRKPPSISRQETEKEKMCPKTK